MSWLCPVAFNLIPQAIDLSTPPHPAHALLPLAPHPGAFGVPRKHHVHEGIDIYVPAGTRVHAVEDGVVVKIEPFTGPAAGSPWWHDTQAVFVEGPSGVVVYGEILPEEGLAEGDFMPAGGIVGTVTPVLRVDKGRPMSMLHLELHVRGTRAAPAWEGERPASLLDPTALLRAACPQPRSRGMVA